ncbi:MAG: insulinase family protein [Treponema sp.]|nr:insulinase family protein [Treponema sp.]
MKKFLICMTLILKTMLFAQESFYAPGNYDEYVLENGMSVFVLEDFSCATIRVEYAVKAGFSSQSQTDTGFFSLYTRLFKKSTENFNELKGLSAECNADSSRYVTSTTPSKISRTFSLLASAAFSPSFSDLLIKDELSELKTEVMQYAYTPAAFINASIDSRVFSASPWKHDSGIYPALFTKTSPAQARTILSRISTGWYVPQNSALFISGCIKKDAALNLAKQTFGQYEAAISPQKARGAATGNKIHKFVLYDNDFSEELSQIIVQYTSLSMNLSDIAAAALNSDRSTLKETLCREQKLNIRESEYINAAAAHKNGTSRLIIQALLERNKTSVPEQCELFLKDTLRAAENTGTEEYLAAKKVLAASFDTVTSCSETFMEYLSQFWALKNQDGEESCRNLAERMCGRPSEINSENTEEINSCLKSESPFVFVLVNTKTYRKSKNLFAKAGYEPVNQKNSSWFMQNLQKNASANVKDEKVLSYLSDFDSKDALERFINESRASLTETKLSNGIPVIFKENKNSSQCAIVLSIDGGKFSEAGKPGFESVMINSLSINIQHELNRCSSQGLLEGFPDVQAETLNRKSLVSIICMKEDATTSLKAVGEALIFSDIAPASADSAVYSVQTQKRIFNASPVNQITFRGIKYLYDDYLIRDIFDSDKDILARTSYTDILSAYPKLLDASRYSIIIAGNFEKEDALAVLNSSTGLLSVQQGIKTERGFPAPDFPSKTKRVTAKIRHLFYTDVKAEDAGPMPAVLVPTKDFADPVQFWFRTPENKTEMQLFNAVLLRFSELLNEKTETRLLFAEAPLPVAAVTFLNVPHTDVIDRIYAEKIKKLKDAIHTEEEAENAKYAWIMHFLAETKTNAGTAKIIAKGSEYDEYLQDYQSILDASPEDFAAITEKYFPDEPLLKVYSSDAKR